MSGGDHGTTSELSRGRTLERLPRERRQERSSLEFITRRRAFNVFQDPRPVLAPSSLHHQRRPINDQPNFLKAPSVSPIISPTPPQKALARNQVRENQLLVRASASANARAFVLAEVEDENRAMFNGLAVETIVEITRLTQIVQRIGALEGTDDNWASTSLERFGGNGNQDIHVEDRVS